MHESSPRDKRKRSDFSQSSMRTPELMASALRFEHARSARACVRVTLRLKVAVVRDPRREAGPTGGRVYLVCGGTDVLIHVVRRPLVLNLRLNTMGDRQRHRRASFVLSGRPLPPTAVSARL